MGIISTSYPESPRMRAKTSKRKKPAPTVAKLKKRAWVLLSDLVRSQAARWDGWVQCYTCDKGGYFRTMQAGHAIGGRNGAVLLDEEIIRPQCVRCNIMLRGNYAEFVTRLIGERADTYRLTINDAFYWWESKLASAKQIKKWSRSELLELIEGYKERLAKL
jgi:NinG protein